MMKIAFTGEGSTDYGKRGSQGVWEFGPAAVYIRNIAQEQGIEIALEVVEKEKIGKVRLQQKSLRGLSGKAVPARKFMQLVYENKMNYGIYYCDADRDNGESNSKQSVLEKRYRDVYDQVNQGLNDRENASGKAIPMIAARMIECWILGDRKALEDGLNIRIDESKMPSNPEIIWGDKRNRNSNYPKNYLDRLLLECGAHRFDKGISAEQMSDVAAASDTGVMKKNCKLSYGRFYDDLCELLKEAYEQTNGQTSESN